MSEHAGSDKPEIIHSESRTRGAFRIGTYAKMTYKRSGDNIMTVDETLVEKAHRGKGLAHRLYHDMVKFARAERRKVIPKCPFVAAMFEQNPGDADVLK